MAATTLIAVWCGYQANWIRQRHNYLAGAQVAQSFRGLNAIGHRSAPSMLWLFGEEGMALLMIDVTAQGFDQLTSADRQRLIDAQRLFPEADIYPCHREGSRWRFLADAQ